MVRYGGFREVSPCGVQVLKPVSGSQVRSRIKSAVTPYGIGFYRILMDGTDYFPTIFYNRENERSEQGTG